MTKAPEVIGLIQNVLGQFSLAISEESDISIHYVRADTIPALLAAEREKALREGFLMGFNASGEGWNGEYPYMDNNVSPITDPEWVKMRDEALSALIDALAPAPEALMTAARELIDGASSSYKARNGREVSIEADDGEMCLIVHSDLLHQLEVALEAQETPILAPQPDLSDTSEPQAISFIYTNYRGETATRTVRPKSIRWGSTEWHPEPGWLMLAYDLVKRADREFALADCCFAPATEVTVQQAARVLADAMEKREWAFYPIEMPVSESGYGPATVGADATSIIYEVWEADTLRSVSSHDTLPDAIIAALRALAEGDSHE